MEQVDPDDSINKSGTSVAIELLLTETDSQNPLHPYLVNYFGEKQIVTILQRYVKNI
jgi:hypothetical protein